MQTRETITLDAKAQQRLFVLTHVLAGELDPGEAAAYLQLSTRQVNRLADRLRPRVPPASSTATVAGGRPTGSTRSSGPRSWTRRSRRLPGSTRSTWPRPSPRAIRRSRRPAPCSGSWPRPGSRRRGRGDHPRTAAGASGCPGRHAAPADGSKHDWLEDRGPELTLIGGIDDATGIVTGGRFRAAEDAAGYLEMLVQTIRRHGLPLALYTDLSGVFIKDPNRPPTLAEQLTGRRSLTQVSRRSTCSASAGSAPAAPRPRAGSSGSGGPCRTGSCPSCAGQASPRSRRPTCCLPATCPVTTAGSRSTRPTQRRPGALAVAPATRGRALLLVPTPAERDATLSWDGGSLSLPRRRGGAGWAGRRVVVQERLDGSLWARDEATCTSSSRPATRRSCGRASAAGCLNSPPRPSHARRSSIPRPRQPRPRGPQDHPWRRYPAVRPKPR